MQVGSTQWGNWVVEVEFSYKGKNVWSKFIITSKKYTNVLGRDVGYAVFKLE